MDPFSLAIRLFVAGCVAHWLPDCDQDARCLQFTNMYQCYLDNNYFKTPAYYEALREGHNPPFDYKPRTFHDQGSRKNLRRR